jgi:hypothetical protein
MQHALNQTWRKAQEETKSISTDAVRPLTVADYEAIGGISGALDQHANQIFNSLRDEQKAVAAAIFRALTWGTSVASAVRRPTSFGDLERICAGDATSVQRILDTFRAPTCNFLQPELTVPLKPETFIDITHESLIRQWTKLRRWVEEELKASEIYRDVERRAKLWEIKGEVLLTMPYLASVLDWRNRMQPNKAWADRYGDNFDLAMHYVAESEAAEQKRADAQKASERSSRRRLGIWAAAVTVLLAIGVASPTLIAELKYALNQAVQKIASAVGPSSTVPPPSGQVASNNDILKNILGASNSEPLTFSGVRMDSTFLQGVLRPLDLQTINLFIRQGYSREMLFWLFMDTMQLTLPGSQTFGYRYNPPDDYGCSQADPKHRCYIDWVHIMTFTGWSVEEKSIINLSSKPVNYARFCFNSVLAQQAAATVSPATLQAFTNDMDVTPAVLFNSPVSCGSDTWNPASGSGMLQTNVLPLALGPVSFTIVPRSASGLLAFLGTLVRIQRQNIQPSQFAFIPSDRQYVTAPPTLLTVHDDANLLTIGTMAEVKKNGGTCFASAQFNNTDYCVPDQATTTKEIFSILAQLIGIQTAP